MRTLSRPMQVGIVVYDDITDDKSKKIVKKHMVMNRRKIDAAYINYISSVPAVDTLVPIPLLKSHKKSLLHAYDSPTAALNTLRDEILEAAIASRCPFCQISTHGTIDHYLPKERYPEFSVFPPNLVPACEKCNQSKRTLIVDLNTGIRLFIHPYYDVIPNVNFIKGKLKIKKNTLVITFEPYHNPSLTAAQYSHIFNHFKTLGLADRYHKSCLTEISDIRDWIKILGNEDAMKLKSKLIEQSLVYSNVGHNYWRRILFETLAADDEFLRENYKYL